MAGSRAAGSPAGVVAAHRGLAAARDIVRDRRTLFRAVAWSLGSPLVDAADDVLDSPVVRSRLGAAFAGAGPVPDADLPPLAAGGGDVTFRGVPVRLATEPDAAVVLAPAIRHVSAAVRAHGDADSAPLILTGDRALRSYPVLLAGLELAFEAVPVLAEMLLPHVALFVVTDGARSGRLGSASDRDHPGLVVLPEPRSAAEAAEAFVHEGSHCAFFDLAVTRDVLRDGHWSAAAFRPSWLAAGSPGWPFEQAFAAWHAYCCLAVLAESGVSPAPGSLLPHAARRAVEIGEHLLVAGRFLGRDGRRLLASVTGQEPGDIPRTGAPAARGPVVTAFPSGDRLLQVRTGGDPFDLVWRSGPGGDDGGSKAVNCEDTLG